MVVSLRRVTSVDSIVTCSRSNIHLVYFEHKICLPKSNVSHRQTSRFVVGIPETVII